MNTALGLFCLWRVWFCADVRLPALIALMVMGGFLFTFAIANQYDGTMLLSAEHMKRTLPGLNLGML